VLKTDHLHAISQAPGGFSLDLTTRTMDVCNLEGTREFQDEFLKGPAAVAAWHDHLERARAGLAKQPGDSRLSLLGNTFDSFVEGGAYGGALIGALVGRCIMLGPDVLVGFGPNERDPSRNGLEPVANGVAGLAVKGAIALAGALGEVVGTANGLLVGALTCPFAGLTGRSGATWVSESMELGRKSVSSVVTIGAGAAAGMALGAVRALSVSTKLICQTVGLMIGGALGILLGPIAGGIRAAINR